MPEEDSATVMMTLAWPHPWPPSARTFVSRTSTSDFKATIGFTTSSEIFVTVVKGGEPFAAETTQSIDVDGVGMAVLTVEWTRGVVRVWLNSQQLRSALDANGERHHLSLETHGFEESRSFDDKGAAVACAQAVANRARRFAAKGKYPGRDRTLEEEMHALDDAVRALAEHVTRVAAGDDYMRNALRAEVRQLVVDLGGKAYSPLLQRVANLLGTALPIYAMPATSMPIPPSFQIESADFVSTVRRHHLQELCDFDDWLSRPYLRRRDGQSHRILSAKEFLAKSAETFGGAHVSGTVREELDTASQHVTRGHDAVTLTHLRVAEIVLELARHLTERAAEAR